MNWNRPLRELYKEVTPDSDPLDHCKLGLRHGELWGLDTKGKGNILVVAADADTALYLIASRVPAFESKRALEAAKAAGWTATRIEAV